MGPVLRPRRPPADGQEPADRRRGGEASRARGASAASGPREPVGDAGPPEGRGARGEGRLVRNVRGGGGTQPRRGRF